MKTITIYLFDPATGECLGAADAHESPMEPGKYLSPIHSTTTPPPQTAAEEAAVFSGGVWTIVPDHRGQVVFDAVTGAESVCDALGDIPAGKSLTPPTASLAELQSRKIDALRHDCASHIYAGFSSAALGVDYTYPAQDKDQNNLTASVLASTLPGIPADWTTRFWCADAAGVWAFRPHTAAQIQQVGIDAKAAIESALLRNATLAAQVAQAATEADVAAVVW